MLRPFAGLIELSAAVSQSESRGYGATGMKMALKRVRQ